MILTYVIYKYIPILSNEVDNINNNYTFIYYLLTLYCKKHFSSMNVWAVTWRVSIVFVIGLIRLLDTLCILNCHIDTNCNRERTLHARDRPRVDVYTPAIRGGSLFRTSSGKWSHCRTILVGFAYVRPRVGTHEGKERDRNDICGKPHILPVNRRPSALHTDFRRRWKLWNAPNPPASLGRKVLQLS